MGGEPHFAVDLITRLGSGSNPCFPFWLPSTGIQSKPMTNNKLLTTFALATFSLSVANAADVFTPGFLKREYFPGQTRPAVEDGTAGAPASVTALSSFESPTNVAENYAQRVSGFFVPATTGDYVFFLAADDDTDLFLSTDNTPANKKLIAQEAGWSGVRSYNTVGGGSTVEDKRSDQFAASEWTPTPNQITLTANQQYYIEAVHHEGGGGDNLAVYIKLAAEEDPANGAAPSAAGGSFGFFAAPATITITTAPQNQTIVEGKNATLSVTATTTSAYGIASYQWKKNGTAIPGATGPTFTLPVQTLADTGAKYTVEVNAAGAPVQESAAATVTVVADTTPPNLVSAGSLKTFAGGSEVGLLFDEALTGSTTTAVANYTIDNGAAITAARYVTNSSGLNSFQQGVILSVTGVTPGNTYTVTAKGVADAKGNAIATPQSATFTASNFSWISLGATVNGVSNEAIAVGTNGFNLVNGGNAFWGSTDDITMVYEPVSGDFDKEAQVEWNDPSSNWARAGISARESLNKGQPTTDATGDNPASRYQMILADPMTKFNGSGANNAFETNRRLDTGGATSARAGGGQPNYPNAYVRLKRVGQRISMFYSNDGQTWRNLGTTDFGDDTVSAEGPLPAQLFVGPTLGVENGNITGEGGTVEQQGAFAGRFRSYGDIPQKARGTQAYSIGLNFGANEEGAQLSTNDVAGVNAVAQANWNNIFGNEVTGQTGIAADKAGASQTTSVTVDVSGSGNTWASQGPRGENNNLLTDNDNILMTGYLDTGDATTTQVKIDSIPTDLTSAGYDVVVYALGGVGDKGGTYRVTDASGTALAEPVALTALVNPTNYVRVGSVATAPTNGNFIVFTNIKASSIIVEATTADSLGTGSTPRAPINAIQLVSPTGLAGGGPGPGPGGDTTASITVSGTTITISSSNGGTVQGTDTLSPANWQDVGAAPQNVQATGRSRFFRIKK
jgi:hypothetical protein